MNTGDLPKHGAHAERIDAPAGDAVAVGPRVSLCCGAVDRVSKELLALVDGGLSVEACVRVKEHAGATVAETVAVERCHEGG